MCLRRRARAWHHEQVTGSKSAPGLDCNGRLDGMPLMPQMLSYCARFQSAPERTQDCDPVYTCTGRRLPKAVRFDWRRGAPLRSCSAHSPAGVLRSADSGRPRIFMSGSWRSRSRSIASLCPQAIADARHHHLDISCRTRSGAGDPVSPWQAAGTH
jgi:hypothetical protein